MSLPRLAAVFFLCAATSLAQSPAKTPDSEKQAVISTLIAMWDALEHADIDRYASYIHPNFTSFSEEDTYLNSGKDYEVRSYTNYLKHAKNLHTDMHQPESPCVATSPGSPTIGRNPPTLTASMSPAAASPPGSS